MTAQIVRWPDGRLHLQHGPIDCVCRAWGAATEVSAAYAQAASVFPDVLPSLCRELPALRAKLPSPSPAGAIARAMHAAVAPYADRFVTPMAAVAGAVADHLLAAMIEGRRLDRAFANDGGDIAFHLTPAYSLRCAMVADLFNPAVDGVFLLRAEAPSRGIATSGRAGKGRGGRSLSLGIADAVTVLARTAAMADAAATMIANAVDLPSHPAIIRAEASTIDPDSDLGALRVTMDVGPLDPNEIASALDAGLDVANSLRRRGLIDGAVLVLRETMRVALPAPSPPVSAIPEIA